MTHYAVEIVPFGDFGNPRVVMALAAAAEAAGWDGLFVWDHLAYAWGMPGGDPWVILSAVAAVTTRLRLGTDVTPLPRRRPQTLALTLATLDQLSQGRLILGAGLGGLPLEFGAFGEPEDARVRAAMMEEALAVLDGLMAGEAVTFHGNHYTVENVTLAPLPVQRPRVPIWIGGESRPALRRAARWDGWVIGAVNEQAEMIKTPAQLAEQVGYIRQHRTIDAPLAVAMSGCSAPGDRAMVAEYAGAGMTWWLETLFLSRGSFEDNLARIEAGPPGD
ncbi:MAG: TIGR03619 family F420-dependent LLM class oxidoreductase [Chloroflexota bacterium]|jgi:probable F420-dependent oxidoreductase